MIMNNLNLFMLKNNLPRKDIFKSLTSLISQGYKSFGIKQKINFTKNLNNRSKSSQELNNEELSLIIQKCKEFKDIESFLILLLIDTGCSFTEN